MHRIVFLLLFFKINIIGSDFETQPTKPIPISLGTHCVVAYMLNHYHIRTYAYPFDWLSTPFTGLYSVLEKDFGNFFLRENLIIPTDKTSQVLDTHTHIIFTHDFPTKDIHNPDFRNGDEGYGVVGNIVDNYLDFYDEVNSKYQRRINRLTSILNSSNFVVFFRYECSRQEAVMLRDLFKNKHPLLNFVLVAINNFPDHFWNEECIINYYIPAERAWATEGSEWPKLFQELNLLP